MQLYAIQSKQWHNIIMETFTFTITLWVKMILFVWFTDFKGRFKEISNEMFVIICNYFQKESKTFKDFHQLSNYSLCWYLQLRPSFWLIVNQSRVILC